MYDKFPDSITLPFPVEVIAFEGYRFMQRFGKQASKENHNYLHPTIYIGKGYCTDRREKLWRGM